jgi:RNA polymerase sigma-70 factor (ECF subfamily)
LGHHQAVLGEVEMTSLEIYRNNPDALGGLVLLRTLAALGKEARSELQRAIPMPPVFGDDFYKFLGDRLRGMAEGRGVSAHRTEELVQDVVQVLWERMPNALAPDAVKYAGAVMRNMCCKEYRDRERMPTVPIEKVMENLLPSHEDTPEAAQVNAEMRALKSKVIKAINSLDERSRAIMTGHLDGLSSAEMAQSLGMTVTNVNVIKHRAKAKLRELLSWEWI